MATGKKVLDAFPLAAGGAACPDTGDFGANPGPCIGCEIDAHLDFASDGDGATYTGAGNYAAGDSGDACHNDGSGWYPQGNSIANRFSATLRGNGCTISNLFIKRASSLYVGLFERVSRTARIESKGTIANAY